MNECLNDALDEVIRAAGGYKAVGLMLRPELSAADGGTWLRNCLSDDRREKPSLDHFRMLLRIGREHGCHAAADFLAADTGYSVTPVEPEAELARVMREISIHTEEYAGVSARLTLELQRATAALKSTQARRKVRA